MTQWDLVMTALCFAAAWFVLAFDARHGSRESSQEAAGRVDCGGDQQEASAGSDLP